jgi:rRNA biogenesis protein RRP5
MALPSPSTSGRLFLLLNSMSEATDTSSSKRAKKKSSYKVGSLVQAEVDSLDTLYYSNHVLILKIHNWIEP